MSLFWKVKKVDTEDDQKIEQIKRILFPPLDLHEQPQEDGSTIKFHIDYSADSNLDAALIDLQEGNNDAVVQKTISSVIDRLNKVRRILDAYAEFDKDAQYIIVDDGDTKKDIEIAED